MAGSITLLKIAFSLFPFFFLFQNHTRSNPMGSVQVLNMLPSHLTQSYLPHVIILPHLNL